MMGLDDRSTENKELGESNEPYEVENNTQGELMLYPEIVSLLV